MDLALTVTGVNEVDVSSSDDDSFKGLVPFGGDATDYSQGSIS